MKFKVTMKDPDGVSDAIDEAVDEALKAVTGVTEEERESLRDVKRKTIVGIVSKFFEFLEYLTVEIDTEAETCEVQK